MGVDLAGQRGQPRLHQKTLLLLEFLFVARVVPDLQRYGDRAQGRRIQSYQRQPRGRRPMVGQPEHVSSQGLPQELGEKNACAEEQVERRLAVIAAFLKEPDDAEVRKWRKSPDLF